VAQSLPPGLQPACLFLGREIEGIGDIINQPAKGIKDSNIASALFAEGDKSEGKIGLTCQGFCLCARKFLRNDSIPNPALSIRPPDFALPEETNPACQQPAGDKGAKENE
jgi:hypothetical protein